MKINRAIAAICTAVSLSLTLAPYTVWAGSQPPPPAAAGDVQALVARFQEAECTIHSSSSNGKYESATIGERLCRWGMVILSLDRHSVSSGTWLEITTNIVPPTYRPSPDRMVVTEPILIATGNGGRRVYSLPITALGEQQYRVQIPAQLTPGDYEVSFRHVLIQPARNGSQTVRVLAHIQDSEWIHVW
jgi:hypothetical protein